MAPPSSPPPDIVWIDEEGPLRGPVASFVEGASRGRDEGVNDDAFFFGRFCEERVCLVAVADGAGGLPHAAEASRAACRQVVRKARTMPPERFFDRGAWAMIFHEIDACLGRTLPGAETTLAVVASDGRRILAASVGDGTVLLVAPSVTETITELRKPRLGSGRVSVFTTLRAARPGMRLLVATDGLHRYVAFEALARRLVEHPPAGLVASLIEQAGSTFGGRLADDATGVLLEIWAADHRGDFIERKIDSTIHNCTWLRADSMAVYGVFLFTR